MAESQTFAPKYALLLILAAAGTVPLIRLAIRSRFAWPARLGIAFVVVAIVSALLSPSKLVGFFGLYLWGEGVIFLFALVAAWALGASLGPQGRSWLTGGLLVGAGVNAVAAVVQVLGHLNTPTADLAGFGLFQGSQADGMMGNPVHLEALLLGALALVITPACRAHGRNALATVAFVALLAAGLECSSERFAIVLLVVLAAGTAWTYRMQAVKYLAALAVGFGVAAVAGAGAPLSQRVGSSSASGTYGLRVHAWIAGIRATVEHRPVFGFGPGEVRNALTLYQSPGFARTLAPGKYFTDLHNLGVNVLVMTGVVGFLLAAAFLVTTSWRVRGGLAGFAALALAVELVEPMNVAVTPLALLALGAALSASRGEAFVDLNDRVAPLTRTALVVLPCLALLPGIALVAGDVAEYNAIGHYSLSDARLANTLLPIWPETADGIAQVYAYESVVAPRSGRRYLELSRHWAFVAATRDPSNTENWVRLTGADVSLGALKAARADANRAIADDPLGSDALSALGAVDAAEGNWSASIAAYRKAASLAPTDARLRSQLGAAERHDSKFFG